MTYLTYPGPPPLAILNKYISNFSGNNSRSTSPAPEAKKEDEKTSKAEKRKQMVDSLLDPNAGPSNKKGRFEGEISKQLYSTYKYIVL